MKRSDAIRAVHNLGGYFYAEYPARSDSEIFALIEDDVRHTGLIGLDVWEKPRDSLAIVLTEYTQEELDDLLLNEYAHDPAEVNSREFFSNLHEFITRAIEERRKS